MRYRARTVSTSSYPGREGAAIQTKFLVPRVKRRVVHRDRLFARLEAGLNGSLTLLCSPPGWGKTTLLIDWLRTRMRAGRQGTAVAWLSLNDDDNDPAIFLGDLTAALTSARVLPSTEPRAGGRSVRDVIVGLVNMLSVRRGQVLLALDDYHVIRRPSIHDGVNLLLEHLPPALHVVILTREDPPLLLPRLRARGALCEIRTADLRFTLDETGAFLREIMGLTVTGDEAAALAEQTEGWITGLQLSALSFPAGASAALGRQRPILDYLGREVLERQPRAVRMFLLRTCVLDELNASLCAAVLADEPAASGAQAMLEHIERANLFVTALDQEGRRYRYHHFFAEFLRVHLGATEPALVPALHRRASDWYAEHGEPRPAIHHALAAAEYDRAVQLIEEQGTAIFDGGPLETVLEWFARLPEDTLSSHPRLGTVYALVLIASNRLVEAERVLQGVVRCLRGDHSDHARTARRRYVLLRGLLAPLTGGIAESRAAEAGRILNLLPPTDEVTDLLAGLVAAQALSLTGDVSRDAERGAAAAALRTRLAGSGMTVRLATLARMHALQGHLRQAGGEFADAARDCRFVPLVAPACAFGLADLHREWNDLDAAEQAVARGMEFIAPARCVEPAVVADGYATLARIRQAGGDHDGAVAALDAFVELAGQRRFDARVLARIDAVRAHLRLIKGDLPSAKRWAEATGVGLDGHAGFVRERELLVLARVLVASGDRRVATLLDSLLRDAEAHGRMRSAVEVLVLQSLASANLGGPRGGLPTLERALALAEPEGYVRMFVDEGAPMATLLRAAQRRGISPEYTVRLLGAFGPRRIDQRPGRTEGRDFSGGPARRAQPEILVDPLTPREGEILALLAAGGSNQDLAQQLFVTTNTIKAHVHHIFDKLGVRSRTQAIAKARALYLV